LHGFADCLEVLVHGGYAVNCRGGAGVGAGWTAAQVALQAGETRCLEVLLRSGADLDAAGVERTAANGDAFVLADAVAAAGGWAAHAGAKRPKLAQYDAMD
jgi:hypothetical protein